MQNILLLQLERYEQEGKKCAQKIDLFNNSLSFLIYLTFFMFPLTHLVIYRAQSYRRLFFFFSFSHFLNLKNKQMFSQLEVNKAKVIKQNKNIIKQKPHVLVNEEGATTKWARTREGVLTNSASEEGSVWVSSCNPSPLGTNE